ncbi:MAG: V-type ATP synthase subunit A, partial [Oscillospiraceae bacterium]
MSIGKIRKVAGPLVVAEGMKDANMFDVVRVGRQKLIGEIIEMRGDKASIQVYEETAGIAPGDIVESTGAPLSVELAPGLITTIYDGIQRPLEEIRRIAGNTITRGVQVEPINHSKKWDFTAVAKSGDHVVVGDILGTVQETIVVLHKIMVPMGVEGEILEIKSGEFDVTQTIAKI